MQPKDRRLVTEKSLEDYTEAELTTVNERIDTTNSRIASVETMAGLAPGEVTDAQTANLIHQPDSSTRTAFNQTITTEINNQSSTVRQALDAVTEHAIGNAPLWVIHGENKDYPRPETNGRPVEWFGTVTPTSMLDGDKVNLYAGPLSKLFDFTEGLSEWTARWQPSDWSTEVSTSEGPILTLTGDAGRRIFTSDEVDRYNASDVEVVARIRSYETHALLRGGVVVRAGVNGTGAENGYALLGISGGAQLYRYWSGGSLRLGTIDKPLVNEDWYWMRLRAEGDTLYARLWLDNETEPATWDLTVTDSTITAGWVGAVGSTSPQKQQWDRIGIAVDGQTAPKEK